jgi:hypothetical protein
MVAVLLRLVRLVRTSTIMTEWHCTARALALLGVAAAAVAATTTPLGHRGHSRRRAQATVAECGNRLAHRISAFTLLRLPTFWTSYFHLYHISFDLNFCTPFSAFAEISRLGGISHRS